MNINVTRQTLVASLLVTIMCIMLLIGAVLISSSITEGHATNTGTMLIAPAYQHQYRA
ncbi:MAG TPA: hypothetical protein VEH81_01675 [Ktedonobacteraceae bacterium]|nr:hypothetical protein [Ktedonobacteraceae bacterium]